MVVDIVLPFLFSFFFVSLFFFSLLSTYFARHPHASSSSSPPITVFIVSLLFTMVSCPCTSRRWLVVSVVLCIAAGLSLVVSLACWAVGWAKSAAAKTAVTAGTNLTLTRVPRGASVSGSRGRPSSATAAATIVLLALTFAAGLA